MSDSERKRKFFSGRSVEQAVVAAANYHGILPEEVDYREIEKRHGFVRARKNVVIAVEPDAPKKRAAAAADAGDGRADREEARSPRARSRPRREDRPEGEDEPPAEAAGDGETAEGDEAGERPRRRARRRPERRDDGGREAAEATPDAGAEAGSASEETEAAEERPRSRRRPRRERPAEEAQEPKEESAAQGEGEDTAGDEQPSEAAEERRGGRGRRSTGGGGHRSRSRGRSAAEDRRGRKKPAAGPWWEAEPVVEVAEDLSQDLEDDLDEPIEDEEDQPAEERAAPAARTARPERGDRGRGRGRGAREDRGSEASGDEGAKSRGRRGRGERSDVAPAPRREAPSKDEGRGDDRYKFVEREGLKFRRDPEPEAERSAGDRPRDERSAQGGARAGRGGRPAEERDSGRQEGGGRRRRRRGRRGGRGREREAQPTEQETRGRSGRRGGGGDRQPDVGGRAGRRGGRRAEATIDKMPPTPRPAPRSERLPQLEGELADAVHDALEILLEFAGVEAQWDLYRNDERVEVELWGPDDHLLLEEDGGLLLAIEHLLPRMLRGIHGDAMPVRVDCNDFHFEREEKLRELAWKTADEVRRNGEPRTLTELDPAERRIVHLTLADDEDVVTESVGGGYYKRLKVLPS